MIEGHCYCFCGVVTIYFSLLIHTFASPTLHFCLHDQRDALLEFKDEFPTDESNLSSWNKSTDCCLWSGVTCDDKYGQVISLDLHETPLNNSLKTNSSFFKLKNLRHLNLSNCNLHGEIPSSLENLSHLTNLDLSANYLVGAVPTSIENLKKLRLISLNNNSFIGHFPKSLFSIPSLQSVDLGVNQFTGPIEFVNTSSSELQFLNLDHNRFNGPIPESISKFLNLRRLYLSHNNFTGPIPRSLSKLVDLKDLHLSKNKLEGEVPGFLWRLTTMMICHNSFSSFETPSQETLLVQVLDLSSNSFHGPLPHWICNLKGLSLLDLSNNRFNGSIPTCLRNAIVSLLDMSLRNNSFSGVLPDIFGDATKLRSIDVGLNQLEGKFPKSLINCKALQLVNVASNRIKDEFPSWLGSLPSLNVLSLRSNEFYGPLYHPHVSSNGFQSLRVIDISHNDFTGTLPPHYFLNWREMTTLTKGSDYMVNPTKVARYMGLFPESIYRSMEMVNKGVETRFDRIRQDFRAIDFSCNGISGEIPESIGFLKGLRLLNLSDNVFTSEIPRSLANLTSLETLDLSSNKLSGQIPKDLGNLAFLSYMNFSHNLLQGLVPRGTQFERQSCSSFSGNYGLYGLEEICGSLHAVSPPTVQEADEYSEADEEMFSWVAAVIAYGPGMFCGLVIGHIFTSHNQERLTEKFGRRKLVHPKCSLSTSVN
ncbi:receptor-like protein 11 [Raphanus sativus]|uniref:Receptor-like protein 11 n=1 Tax=Raphanus sativus TaxID=3726 RepID=A0A6J0K936_RAPSA|nr:receptor-like protein 11 [Raphanus sativus]